MRWLSADFQTTPFDRLAWWQGLEEHCGIKPAFAVAREGDALAVLPLTGGEGHFSALSNWYTFRFRPLVTPGADRLLAALAGDLKERARRVTLTGLPDEDGMATRTEAAFRQAGWIVLREQCDTNHILEVGGRGYGAYIAGRPGALRTTLKRKSGKVDVQVLTRFDGEAWSAYEEIYAESWKPEEGSPAFLHAFAQAEAAAGRLRLGIARPAGGTDAIAAQMWTVEGNTAFIHKLAHREAAKALSPGSVLTAALFRHVIEKDNVTLVDFGTGDDPYKRDWMESTRPRFRLDMFRPMALRNWPFFAKFGLRRLAARAKRG